MKSWVSETRNRRHGLRYRAIAKTFEQGYKASRICSEYDISTEMLAAILVDYGGRKDMQDAWMWINRRERNGSKKKAGERRADSIQSHTQDGEVV